MHSELHRQCTCSQGLYYVATPFILVVPCRSRAKPILPELGTMVMEMHYTIVELDETMLTEHTSRVRESVTLKLFDSESLLR